MYSNIKPRNDSGMHQWYQSRRSSAAHQKIENEDEIEIEGSYFSNWTGSTKAEDEGGVCWSKNFQESIEGNMNEIRRMIADMTSKQSNYSDFSSRSISNRRSSSYRESQDPFDTKSMRNYQVSLQSDSSKLYKKYKLYRAVELDDRRDRGLCLWCDEFFYLGHECCKKKKLYVFDIDVDDALEVSECNGIESPLTEELVETKFTDFDENLIGHSIPTYSILMKKLISVNENGREEMNEVQDKDHKAKNIGLQVFDKMPMKDTFKSMIESGVNEIIGCTKDQLCILDATLECLDVFTTSRALWLCDVGNGELIVVIVKNHLPRDRAELFDLMSTVESINQSCWVEWPEPPLPLPEPPPRLI